MDLAYQQAVKAFECEEVPVGAVVVDGTGKVLAKAYNLTEKKNDPTAHAEILVLQKACKKLGVPRLPDCDLYVTLEPCTMCAAAISFARIAHLYFGAFDPKGGGVSHGAKFFDQPTCHHRPKVLDGCEGQRSKILLQQFFQDRRKK